VALVYFDSSALVKLLVDEAGTDLVVALWDACDAALSSRLAHPEVTAALAAAGRNHDIADLPAMRRAWKGFWSAIRPVELTEGVEQHAARLAAEHHLRGADAVHLASALAVGDPNLVMAVWDRRLHASALTVGLATAPATLP